MGEFRYKAFISYSWADAAWGKWIHHAIETYHAPAALVGKETPIGPVPRRLHPLFKDREEEAAGASIGAAVEAALGASEFMIVVCSPNSAKSQWVNREIAWFKTHRDPARILALIVGGEPGDPEQECFPGALTHEVEADMTVSDRPVDTPLAADARESGDGKRMARLKIAAAMLGLGLDELVRRDDRRRLVRARAVTAASLALAAVMGALTWLAVEARNEAEFQRGEADALVEFMLTDLREKLEPVGRLDALDVVGGRALDYYAKQKLGDLDADALGRRARALLLVGEISNLRGDSDEALKAFEEAAATTGEQLARDPDNGQRIYDHAQSVFWVGYVAYNRGELADAEAQFREYQRLAKRLVALDPDKPEWQMEASYAASNLGVMYQEQGRHTEAGTAFADGLAQIDAVAAREEWSAGRQVEVGIVVNWLGRSKWNLGQLEEARRLHEREIDINLRILEEDAADASARNRLAVAYQFLCEVEVDSGDLEAALESSRQAVERIADLRRLERDNTEWQQSEVGAQLQRARILGLAGRHAEAGRMLDRAGDNLARLVATDPANSEWAVDLAARHLRANLRQALATGDLARAERRFAEASAFIAKNRATMPSTVIAQTLFLGGEFKERQRDRSAAEALWAEALEVLPGAAPNDGLRYMLLERLDRREEAAGLAGQLDERGYRHPAFVAARRSSR